VLVVQEERVILLILYLRWKGAVALADNSRVTDTVDDGDEADDDGDGEFGGGDDVDDESRPGSRSV